MTGQPRAVAAVALCFGAIVFDGYDLIVYGSALPALLAYEPWALTPAQAGAIGSYALFGMFLGAIADRSVLPDASPFITHMEKALGELAAA